MKSSNFNYFVKEGERVIWSNTISGSFFSVNHEEHKILSEILSEPLNTERKTLRDWLIERSFIVLGDEISTIKLKNRETVFENTYNLIINPTVDCNFSCWYCYQNHSHGRMKDNTIEGIKKFVDRLVFEKKIKGIDLSWFGGEPLLHFNKIVYQLSLYIKELMMKNSLTFSNSITSNGFLATANKFEQFEEIGLNVFQITLDGDRESHNKTRNINGKPSFDVIINNIISLCSYNPDNIITLRINYTDDIIKKNFGEILNVIPLEIRKQIKINFQRVWQTSKVNEDSQRDNPYLKNSIIQLREMGFNISIASYQINFNNICYADRFYYAHINYDGKVYKCTARDYTDENQVGTLTDSGQIIWKSGELEKRYLKANFDNDQCLKCKKLSICGGPCSQVIVESNKYNTPICAFETFEIEPNTFIKESYHSSLAYHRNKCH